MKIAALLVLAIGLPFFWFVPQWLWNGKGPEAGFKGLVMMYGGIALTFIVAIILLLLA